MAERVEIGLGKKHRILLGRRLECLIGVLPEQFHVVPVLNNTVAHWILQLEQALAIGVELLSYDDVGLVGGGNHYLVLGSSDATSTLALH